MNTTLLKAIHRPAIATPHPQSHPSASLLLLNAAQTLQDLSRAASKSNPKPSKP